MGNNQSEPSEPFDPDDLSQWELRHLLAIDDAYRARGLEYSVDQTTFRDLFEAPYETTINGLKVPCAAPLPGVGDETFDYLWRMFSFLDARLLTLLKIYFFLFNFFVQNFLFKYFLFVYLV